ncbi:MAG: nucleotidyl transferase AbiEii/AbiGii toxin family protein [Brevundimonas sp.]|uniref:nucleotidyl transferase AbiEii/AbiGii toxin family protein n=1 Tax=Brevundimonas sp. TaxID=1871086 RepID=UPI002AB8D5C2|nr:nucleotidyl transferase AbiEii/AbiGii toxin family protein [Brevundimonas sp.]MDZ4112245.1 nucleotidyl transferase AbiEii/AbiGii toxin family protein [Brevundimonas sp.]
MADPVRNMGASVRARLQTLSRTTGQPFETLLVRYALERLLYRLSSAEQGDRFVLKGAMLLMTWLEIPLRGTRDIDFLGFGEPSPEGMLQVFREVLAIPVDDDGVVFDVDGLRVDRIREEAAYGGLRLQTTATIDRARIKVTIDIGFGDATEPGIEEIDYPALLDFPTARLRTYARETVIAEKFQAMVDLGRANTRLKDFYDVWVLSRLFAFDDDRLARAMAATFARRGTALPTVSPDALTPAFSGDPEKRAQWRAFVENLAEDPGDLDGVVEALADFLMPHALAAARHDPAPPP